MCCSLSEDFCCGSGLAGLCAQGWSPRLSPGGQDVDLGELLNIHNVAKTMFKYNSNCMKRLPSHHPEATKIYQDLIHPSILFT